jgi:hypothetical protein
MRLIFLFIGVLSMSLFATANTAKERVLYFCDYANGIFSYGLEFKKLKLLYKSEVNNYVMSITEMVDGNIAFSECKMVGSCQLKVLDKTTLSVEVIGQGSSIKIHGDILLFTKAEEKFNGHELRISKAKDIFDYIESEHIYGPVEPSSVVVTKEGIYYTNKSVGVGIVSTLFYYSYSEQRNIAIRNHLIPVFYSENDDGLVAYDLAEHNYTLVRIKGSSQVPDISLHTDLDISASIVVKDKHNLFYDRYATKWLIFERINIYKKNLLTGKEELLIENKQLLSGFVSD